MARIINRDPVEGLVEYLKDIKPYHTKIISVLVEYIHTDYINVTFTEDLRWSVGILLDRYDPACPVGFDQTMFGELADTDPLFISDILNVNTILNTIRVGGDQTSTLFPGSRISIQNSTGNNGTWIVSTTAYTSLTPSSGYTTVAVTGDITDPTIDGQVYLFLETFDAPSMCPVVSEGEVRASFAETLTFEYGSSLTFFDTIAAHVCDSVGDTQYGGITELEVTPNVGTDVFTFVVPEQFMPLSWGSGHLVYFQSSGSLPSPLQASTPYYLIKLSPTTFKVSTTYVGSGALGDPIVPVDITTSGTGTLWLVESMNIEHWDRCGWSTLANLSVHRFVANAGTDAVTTYDISGNDLAPHQWVTGDRVYLVSSGALPAPLLPGTPYYVIRTSSTTFDLAYSLAAAQTNTKIDITSAGTGSHYVERTKPFLATTITAPTDTLDASYTEGLSSNEELMIIPSNVGGIGSNADAVFTETFNVFVTNISFVDTIGVGFAESSSQSTITIGGEMIGSFDYPYFDIGTFDESLVVLPLITGNTYSAP